MVDGSGIRARMELGLGLGGTGRKWDGTGSGQGSSAHTRFRGEYLVLVRIGRTLWVYTCGF